VADYYVYKMPKNAQADGRLDKAQTIDLVAMAGAVAGTDKMIYLSGPHDTAEQKAAIKAVRTLLMSKGVPAERVTTSRPSGEAVHLGAHNQESDVAGV
jgi:hypothetical protein